MNGRIALDLKVLRCLYLPFHAENAEDHLKELVEGNNAVAIHVHLAKDHFPLAIINSSAYLILLRLLHIDFRRDSFSNYRITSLCRLLLLCVAPKHHLDFIDCNGAGLICVKHVEDLSHDFLIDYFLRVKVSNQELRVVNGSIVIKIQFLKDVLRFFFCANRVAVEILPVALVDLVIFQLSVAIGVEGLKDLHQFLSFFLP